MDPALPLSKLVLAATSVADDLGFVALADTSDILKEHPDLDYRLIGGHMVSLHAQRWGFGRELYRETADMDIGLPTAVAKDPWLVDQLIDKGYERKAGNRFERPITDIPVSVSGAGRAQGSEAPIAAIDILIPAYTRRARESYRVGDHLTSTQVRGLAPALNRPSVDVELALSRLNGDALDARIRLPDEVSTLVLRAFAWRVRSRDTDAVDLWRSLEICRAASVGPDQFVFVVGREAAAIIRAAFARRGLGAFREIASARGLSKEARTRLETRIYALIDGVLGPLR
jgi:hypothetical protein